MDTKFYVVVGDWSGDGHGKHDEVLLYSNKTIKEMQEGYKASCKLTGLQFNHNENYTDKPGSWGFWWQIFCEYEDNKVSKEALEVLKSFGCDLDKYGICSERGSRIEGCFEESTKIFAELIMWFIQLSIPDLEWTRRENEYIPCLNGDWDENLNCQFGYGLY